jgi:glycosyltransferase involved in cell wall biosynthesis
MNAFGDAAEHCIISSVPGQLAARDAIDRGIAASFPNEAPPLTGRPSPARLLSLSRYMRRFDLVLTYNWGAFDAVMARRLFGGPPLVHHEDGFNEDEAEGLDGRRNFYRRIGLGAAHRLVVPSRRLETIARSAWRQPAEKVWRIPNGIALDRYAAPASRQIPGLQKQAGELVIGTVAGLRPVKNLPRLVRAFVASDHGKARLAIVGTGPESERIAAEARSLGVADRLVMPGFLADPAGWIGHFDLFALSSDSEQFPISLVEAMAAGLPAVATAVGDVPLMVSDDNRPLVVEPADEAAFAAALDSLLARPDLRRAIGRANRAKAAAEFDERGMIDRYARLYGEAIGRPDAFSGCRP